MKLTKKRVMNSRIVQSIKNFANSNFVAKIIAGIVIWGVTLIPMWIYLFSRMLVDPIGFWQELALFAIFAIVLGWLQAILLFLGTAITFLLISDEL